MRVSIAKKPDDLVNFPTKNVASIEELAGLIVEHSYSLSTFTGGYRKKSNFIQAEAIGLDFDEGYTLTEAVKDFADAAHIIAPTRSHGVEKNGKIQDRFRVILFLSEPIRSPEVFEATWFALAEIFPKLDHACKDPSRFFFPSMYVESINAKGSLVAPVQPAPKPEKKEVNIDDYLPGTRGELGRATKEFLDKGFQEGGRNNATVKAAKDFQQNLYPIEEAIETIVSALHRNGTIAADFPESEVISTIRSAYRSEPKHDPRIKQLAFKLQPIGELYRDNTEVDWLVHELLSVGGVSVFSADPKAGKSTILRQLAREVLRGGRFLDRQCKQGAVQYYAIEEQKSVINKSFRRLGVRDDEPLLVHLGDALTDDKWNDFREILITMRPALAIVDTMFDFIEVESENNYKEVKRELRKLRSIARESGTHIVLVHHNSKGSKDDKRRGNRSILGSTAISGGVDTIIVMEIEGETRFITTSGREVRRWAHYPLEFHSNDFTYTLGKHAEDF